MDKLIELGFSYRFDTYFSYWITIRDFDIMITKYHKATEYKCYLINRDSDNADEVLIKDDCDLDFVVKLYNLLR